MKGLIVGDEVREALDRGVGVVALETSVIGQGLPVPRNAECVRRMDAAIRGEGAVPAWIGVARGALQVGLGASDLEAMAVPGAAVKVARRDIAPAMASGALGATTVSATVFAAHAAGIPVGATGGIGGVHPGTGDVSADLLELGRTPVLLVCSGPKSIIDPAATAEKLEELGVTVVGHGCERMPHFLVTSSEVALEHRVGGAAEAAAMLAAASAAAVPGAILLCNPIPPGSAMDPAVVEAAVHAAEADAVAAGVTGKAVTPFLLSRLAHHTGGASLEANLDLLEANAALAARIATVSAARS